MDGIHEAHLSRILEGRRRRGVLGDYSEPIAAPPPRAPYVSPPPPPPPRRVSSAAGTQTVEERKYAAAAQTSTEWGSGGATAAAERPFRGTSAAAPSSQVNAPDWRQSAPRTGGLRSSSALPPPLAPNYNATLDGAVQFQSPGRVPSLAYSSATPTPSPAGQQRQRQRQPSLWQPPTAAPAWTSSLVEDRRHSIEPLPPPLYIPRSHSTPRDGGGYTGSTWQSAWAASPRPVFEEAPLFSSGWRSRADTHNAFSSGLHIAPLSSYRDDNGGSGAASMMGWPGAERREWSSPQRPHHRASRSGHQHHHRHHNRHNSRPSRDYRDDFDEEGEREVDFPPPPRHRSSRSAVPRRGASVARRRSAPDSPARPARGREGNNNNSNNNNNDPRSGRSYAPPVVYMGQPSDARGRSLSSGESLSQQRRSRPSASVPRPMEAPRKTALGLPDARSTMDLRTSIETLRAGDWFYKWSAKGDVVHRRWVWVDTKSYLLVWSNQETRNPNFCGNVRLDHICQVTSRDLTSVDEDGFPKTYYVLLIETTKRVLQVATELKDKCDAWFEALNNVMGFIHRNDIAKGALMPD